MKKAIRAIVFLIMATLATATHPHSSKSAAMDPALQKFDKIELNTQLRIIAEKLDEINQLNWNLIDTLINYEDRILANKEVAVDGTVESETLFFYEGELVCKNYLFKLIRFLSRTDWELFHRLINNNKLLIVDEIKKLGKNALIVADILIRMERMKGVDWKKYFKLFAIANTMTPVTRVVDQDSSHDLSTKCLTPKGNMDELDKSMLEIDHLLDEIHTSNINLNRIRSNKLKSIYYNKRY